MTVTGEQIRVLDNGYIMLVDHMGDDLRVANSARVSFKRGTNVMRPEDERLVDFLARSGHTSPFRHNMVTFEVCAPIMVMRQIQRYVIGGNHTDTMGGWSEESFRYVSKDFSFYLPRPDQWRGAPENKKQGAKGQVDPEIGGMATRRLLSVVDKALDNYQWAINQGICAEQARLYLPAFGLYSTWYMTLSLQAACHLIAERTRPDAMYETRQYARTILEIIKDLWPLSVYELLEHAPVPRRTGEDHA